ncbi:type III pantothenate kinase [Hespellia stercorisuis]|uniref:Type III pantothenate kinase n=1 Tax=Hespellia stercorisuis DSM 15480 TaxID=1121950 RepID=A0A1M6NFB0_9FIRM|nr:type III pantothenate kinase [Hespellia stercorisuis]SHJ94377.1 pantothenate kinase [Hespellia stercorisuis DSM 15480]
MLLAVDVGNTNVTMGAFDGDELKGTFRMTSKRIRTSDEYGLTLCGILEHRGIMPSDFDAVIVASVVPDIMHSLGSAIVKYFNIKPIVVSSGIKTGLKIVTENPKQIGPDRIVDAVAAYELYGGPLIVVDFGTATTYDLVGENGTFEAGVTAPGLETSARSLWNEAAMLPAIEIQKPASILGRETISSMQAGLVYGAIGQTEYIIKEMRRESGYENLKVVATGGLGRIIAQETDAIDIYSPKLTLEGLRIIYYKNKR